MSNMHPRFLGSELAPRPARECRFQVVPVPYEASVSYGGGTALGPAALLEASNQLEVWTGRSVPSDHGIFTHPAVDCAGLPEDVLARIEHAVHAVLEAGPQGTLPARPPQGAPCAAAPAVPVLLGGEHSLTLGALRALKQRYGTFGVVQFDAHADLRHSYEGSVYSHACIMRRAVDDLALPIFQVGVRSLSPEEVAFRKERAIPYLDARDLYNPNTPGTLAERLAAALPEDFPSTVFLTFDIDALDASLMPATGTPEPGGLFWWDALALAEQCLAGRVCLGFDVVEAAPIPGLHAPDYTAARLVHELMGLVGE